MLIRGARLEESKKPGRNTDGWAEGKGKKEGKGTGETERETRPPGDNGRETRGAIAAGVVRRKEEIFEKMDFKNGRNDRKKRGRMACERGGSACSREEDRLPGGWCLREVEKGFADQAEAREDEGDGDTNAS